MKEKIIHFDGADKTGKDTIRDKVVKEANGAYLIYVRSYISQIVYSRLYNRDINEYVFWKRMKEDYDKGDIFVYFECDLSAVKNRFIQHDEKDLSIEEYENHRKVFNDVIVESNHHGIHIKKINTTYNSIDETVEEVKNIINYR